MLKRFLILSMSCLLTLPLQASWNWAEEEKSGHESTYIAIRGGLSGMIIESIDNKVGMTQSTYDYNSIDDTYSYLYPGGTATNTLLTFDYGKLDAIKPEQRLGSFFSIAFGTRLKESNWRAELAWDHFSNMRFSSDELLSGQQTPPEDSNLIVGLSVSTAYNAKLTSDVMLAMIYYDFQKSSYIQNGSIVPFIGAGVGYAINESRMELNDRNGETTSIVGLDAFCTKWSGAPGLSICESYMSEGIVQRSMAAALTTGFTYHSTERSKIEAGIKGVYIGSIDYGASSSTSDRILLSIPTNMLWSTFLGYRYTF
ncbi:MAG: hypothetical protein JJV93_00925 [Alphaproteobacteria bacterium]|nr:hypothetical protein [Alphaproteobacteria bacterium]MBL0717815.1 hypothetical protein [Alphaproteobacteria bacterium]